MKYPKIYCTDLIFLMIIMCVTYSSTIILPQCSISSLFSRYHSCMLKFISTGFNYKISNILKTKRKLKIMRDNIVFTHTMTSRLMNSVQ